jgi:adenylate kinase family enzyme
VLVERFEEAIRRSTARGKKWPTLNDLEKGAVFIPETVFDELLSSLEEGRRVLVVGAQGRGKSTLAKAVGFQLLKAGERVYTIDCASEGKQTAEEIGTVIANRDQYHPLWIIDDIQADSDLMASVYERIEGCRSSRFLFIWRKTLAKGGQQIAADEDWLDALLNIATVIQLKPDVETMKGIIATYINSHQQEERFSTLTLPADVTLDDYRWTLDTTGGNLRTLTSYLDIWDPRIGPLKDLRREMILHSIENQRLKPLLEEGEEILKTYVDVAGVYQFDVAAWAGAFPAAALDQLEQRGEIMNYEGGYYGLEHSSDARDVIEAFAKMRAKKAAMVTDAVISTYVESDGIPNGNLMRLMRGVGEVGWYVPSAPVREHFADLAAHSQSLPMKTRYVRSLCIDSSAVRSFVKLLGGKRFASDLVKQTTMPKLRDFLSALRRIDSNLADELESALTIEDKVHLYSRGKLAPLARSLTYYMRNEKSRPFARRILSVVAGSGDLSMRIARTPISGCGRFLRVASDIDEKTAKALASLIADHVSLQAANNPEELSMLITNLRVNEHAGQRLVQRVVDECGPEPLIASAEPDAYTFLLASIADHFNSLSDRTAPLRFFTAFELRFDSTNVAQLSDRSLAAVIWAFLRVGQPLHRWLNAIQPELASRLRCAEPENAFWLLWNLLQTDERFYRQLTDVAKENIEQRVNSGGGLGASELALIGVLAYRGLPVRIQTTTIQTGNMAGNLLNRASASKILFALLGTKEIDDVAYVTLLEELQAKVERLPDLVHELISQTTVEESRKRLLALAERMFTISHLNNNSKDQI